MAVLPFICNFDVAVRGGELCLLCCHLDRKSVSTYTKFLVKTVSYIPTATFFFHLTLEIAHFTGPDM